MTAHSKRRTTRPCSSPFLAENPDLERIELLFPDMNGIFRGKWLPPEGASKAPQRRCPPADFVTYVLDIWGRDVEATAAGS